MKKIVLITLISIIIVATGAVCKASEEPLTITVDDKVILFGESTGLPYVTDTGRTMVPLRICLSSIGCEVDWNQQRQTVISRKGQIKVQIPIGKKEILKNQIPISIDTAAVVKNGRTYLPLREVMEAYGYAVDWDSKTRIISVTQNTSYENMIEFTPFNINGGSTGIFSRKQLEFKGFDGVQAEITLPMVKIAEKGDCPYVYFGFDWKNDEGNVEGGFQFIEDPNHPNYNKWTVYMRQGNDWLWGNNIALEQGSTHHIKFYSAKVSEEQVDLVIELDGREIIRKVSTAIDFKNTSVKAVTSIAMSKTFDGTNCFSRSDNCKITNMKVSEVKSDLYLDFKNYDLYSEWRPTIEGSGTWFGTVDCIPSYLNIGSDGAISIYKGQ
ncbi:stalk domain-containing protein [Tepidibacter hydrothermalis]|uniref:Stalk domain-containing protein n=1 Tax=Tepidibacter hydrothermalis TaxID=3036126 RepID=A0ABY8EKN3_9FIRM|nr:stalk domain-containing protein [Tepidibacter hydrothermalis]WFD11805.1 stalk domain-containing protein [Tepidibacter hydrothermalis]